MKVGHETDETPTHPHPRCPLHTTPIPCLLWFVFFVKNTIFFCVRMMSVVSGELRPLHSVPHPLSQEPFFFRLAGLLEHTFAKSSPTFACCLPPPAPPTKNENTAVRSAGNGAFDRALDSVEPCNVKRVPSYLYTWPDLTAERRTRSVDQPTHVTVPIF